MTGFKKLISDYLEKILSRFCRDPEGRGYELVVAILLTVAFFFVDENMGLQKRHTTDLQLERIDPKIKTKYKWSSPLTPSLH